MSELEGILENHPNISVAQYPIKRYIAILDTDLEKILNSNQLCKLQNNF